MYTNWNGIIIISPIRRIYLIGGDFKEEEEVLGKEMEGIKKKPRKELTSPNAEEKGNIKEGIASDDDLWDVIKRHR